MGANLFQKRKLTSAICAEWLKKKDFTDKQAGEILRYVENHIGKPKELYDLYDAVSQKNDGIIGTTEIRNTGVGMVLRINTAEIKRPMSEIKKILEDLILITEEPYPLGSVVNIDISEIEGEQPLSCIKAVVAGRYMKKTERLFVPYCGVVYPFGEIKKQILFTGKAVREVISRGYEDEQENAYIAAMKRELLRKGYKSYVFADKGEEEK